MPRTKRPVNKKEKLEVDETSKNLERILLDQKNKIDMCVKVSINDIELTFKILMDSIGSNLMQKTVGELKNELLLNEEPTTRRSGRSSHATSHDDGYLTENSTQGSGERRLKSKGPPPTVGRSTGRRSRSADTTARKPPSTINKTIQRSRSKSVYRTPAYNKNAAYNYPAITPKVAPHMPLTVLRQARQGEMVLSMSGSPVMVNNCNNGADRDQKANCNIMLEDGTMLSLQPNQLRKSQAYIPFALMGDKNTIAKECIEPEPSAVLESTPSSEAFLSQETEVKKENNNVAKLDCSFKKVKADSKIVQDHHNKENEFDIFGKSVLQQLEILKDNLDTVVNLGKNALTKK